MPRSHDRRRRRESDAAQVVLKRLRGKFVSIGVPTRRIGCSLAGSWRWTTMAAARYTQEDLDMATAFIEGN